MDETATPDLSASSTWSRRVQQIWLAVLFLIGFGFIIIVPPFQTIDEVAHWDRTWTVAGGDYNCTTLPTSAAEFAATAFRYDTPEHQGPISWSLFRELKEFTGSEGEMWIATAGCYYPPVGYVLPALAARLVAKGPPLETRRGKMFAAFYAMRTINWLLFFGCVVLAYRLSRFPMVPLVFTSIPMVVHQAIAINNDSLQFGGVLVAAALLTRQATRRTLWIAIALVCVMSWIKVIDAVLLPLIWGAMYVAYKKQRIGLAELAVMAVVSVVVPIGLWFLWRATMVIPNLGMTTGLPVPDVSTASQTQRLLNEPLLIFQVFGWQFTQIFTSPPIDGGWRGLFLALGWYRYTVADHVYWLAIAALGAGLGVLRWDARPIENDGRPHALAMIGTIGCLVAYGVLVIYAMFASFTPYGAHFIFGVQGRYFLYPLAVVFFLYVLRRARPPLLSGQLGLGAACVFVALALSTHVTALLEIRRFFWQA